MASARSSTGTNAPRRYVAGALPRVPFGSNSFPLVLSANFLFLYSDRLGFEFYARALRELARVSADEVRVFPLAALDADRSPHLRGVVAALREDGLAVESVPVHYEFQPGATEMLVLSGCESYR